MSREIDERVVEMRFDNSNFERNVSQSMSTIEKLKSSLKFKGAADGLDEINKAAGKIDFSGFQNGVETVQARFSMLEVAAISALNNIVNKAVDAGTRLVKSFTIEPILTGFNEFEQKMNSSNVLMNSAFKLGDNGEHLKLELAEINKYLEDLNTYSDRTIYSFQDMTTNIAKFTNAGVDMDTAVNAIKGISNEAALSGATANEAARAMYNFSQALSTGYIQRIDWKSIENANMATVEFKDELLKTAVEMGTVKQTSEGMYMALTSGAHGSMKEAANAAQMFTSNLDQQWLTSEVLTKTLARYSDETTELGKKAYKAAEEVKTFSMMIDTLKEAAQSSWAVTWESIFGNLNEGKKLWTDLSEILTDIFVSPRDATNEMLKQWKELGGRDSIASILVTTMSSLRDILNTMRGAWQEVFPPKTAAELAKITKNIENFTKQLSLNDKELGQLKTGFKGVASILRSISTIIKRVISLIIPTNSQIMSTKSGILSVIETIGNVLIKVDEWIQNNNKLFDSLKDIRTTLNNKFADLHVLESISNLFDKIGEKVKKVKDIFKDVDFSFKGIGTSIKNAVSNIWARVKDAFKNFSLSDLFKNIDFGKILKGAGFAGIILVINKLANAIKKFNPLKKITDSLSDTFDKLGDTLSSLKDKLTGGKLADFDKFVKPMLKFAIAIGILAVSFKVLGSMNWDQIKQATASLTAIVVELGGALVLISKFAGKSTAKKILQFSIAVAILTACFKSLGNMEWSQIGKASTALLAIIVELTGALLLLSNFSGNSTAKKILQFSISIGILTLCFKSLGDMSWGEIGKATVALLAIIGELTAAFLLIGNFGGIFAPSKVLQMTVAIGILTICFESLSKLSWDEIGRGTSALGFIISEITGMFVILGNLSGIFSPSKVLQVTTCIGILTICFESLSKLNDEQIKSGTTALGFITDKVVEIFVLLGNFSGIFAPHKVVQVTTCVAVLSACFIELSKIPAEACKVASDAFNLITNKVVDTFVILGNASGFFAPHKVTQITVCIKTLSDCFVDLSEIDSESEKVAADAFELITSKVVTIFTELGNHSGIFAPRKVGQVTSAIATLTDSFVKLSSTDSLMVDSAVKSMETNTPKIVNTIMSLSSIKSESNSAVIVGENFASFAQKLMSIDISIRDHANALKDSVITLNNLDTTGMPMVGAAIVEFANNIASISMSAFNSVVNSFAELGTNISKTIANNIEQYNVTGSIQNLINSIISGLESYLWRFDSIGDNYGSGLISAFSKKDYYYSGQMAGNGFAAGANEMYWACYNAGASLASATNMGYRNNLRIKSPSRVAIESARYFGFGIVKGIEKSEKAVYNAGSNLGSETNSGFKNAIEKLKNAINTDIDYNPTITPVLDLSQIQNGISNLNSMFGGTSLGVSSLGMADGISARMNVSTIPTESTSGTGVDISRAITDANAVQNSLLREEVGLLKQIIESGLSIDFDSRQITTMVTKGQRQMARANG